MEQTAPGMKYIDLLTNTLANKASNLIFASKGPTLSQHILFDQAQGDRLRSHETTGSLSFAGSCTALAGVGLLITSFILGWPSRPNPTLHPGTSPPGAYGLVW